MKTYTHIVSRLAVALLLSLGLLCVPSTAAGEITVYLDGKQIQFDQPPVAMNNRTLVPLRAIFEALGAQVEWHPENQGISAQKGDTLIVMQLGGTYFAKQVGNGEAQYIELDQPPVAINNRTLVPVRAVSESFDCNVNWDAAGNRVLITTAGGSPSSPSAVDDDRIYANYRHSTDRAYRSAMYDGDTLYFSFTNNPELYVYDGSAVRSFNAGNTPTDIVARDGMVYYYGSSNQAVYSMNARTGERKILFNQSGQMDMEKLLLYRDYLLIHCDASVYAVDLNTGSSRLLYDSPSMSNGMVVTAADGKVYILDHYYVKPGWANAIVEADPATGSSRTLYDGVGNQLFCATDGSGIYFYTEEDGVKTRCFRSAATGSVQTVSESAYQAAETACNQVNLDSWVDDWYYGSTNAGVYRYDRNSDLKEQLYRGSGCLYLANNQSQVAFVQSEGGFTPGSSSWGFTAVYVMDLDGNGLTEIINNGESPSGGGTGTDSGTGSSLQPMACPVCGGNGRMTCALCEGSTVDFYGNRCTFCGGSGWRVCPGCNGAGTINP